MSDYDRINEAGTQHLQTVVVEAEIHITRRLDAIKDQLTRIADALEDPVSKENYRKMVRAQLGGG